MNAAAAEKRNGSLRMRALRQEDGNPGGAHDKTAAIALAVEAAGDTELTGIHSPAGARQLQALLADRFGQEESLLRHAQLARGMGSELVASVLEAGYRNLACAPRTAELIRNWVGDPAEAALAMRFNAALHALARQGRPPLLQALYRGAHQDFDAAIAQALTENDDFVEEAMRHPTQTNEVGRAAAFVAALMTLASRHDYPFELLELGTSCGLNLNLDAYAYELGGVISGAQDSPVRIAPEWLGPPPVTAPFEVVSARGIDLNPLDPTDVATVERLMSFIWANEPARLLRLEQAISIARTRRPHVERGNAAPWLAEQLRVEQPAGQWRVIFHSMVLQYFSPEDRQAVTEAIHSAGERATVDRPLAWISYEWTRDRREVQLLLTSWPDGRIHHLATCHPYGARIEWHG